MLSPRTTDAELQSTAACMACDLRTVPAWFVLRLLRAERECARLAERVLVLEQELDRDKRK